MSMASIDDKENWNVEKINLSKNKNKLHVTLPYRKLLASKNIQKSNF